MMPVRQSFVGSVCCAMERDRQGNARTTERDFSSTKGVTS